MLHSHPFPDREIHSTEKRMFAEERSSSESFIPLESSKHEAF